MKQIEKNLMAPDLSESISVSWAFLAVSRAEARLSSSATVMLTTRATLPGIIMFKFQYTVFNELSSSLIFLPHSPFLFKIEIFPPKGSEDFQRLGRCMKMLNNLPFQVHFQTTFPHNVCQVFWLK